MQGDERHPEGVLIDAVAVKDHVLGVTQTAGPRPSLPERLCHYVKSWGNNQWAYWDVLYLPEPSKEAAERQQCPGQSSHATTCVVTHYLTSPLYRF